MSGVLLTQPVSEKKIAKAVAALEKRFAPDVVRIRYSLMNDWSGDPAIYFRLLMTDDAARHGEVARRWRQVIHGEVDPLNNWGLIPYTRYRSVSEQDELRDPAWN